MRKVLVGAALVAAMLGLIAPAAQAAKPAGPTCTIAWSGTATLFAISTPTGMPKPGTAQLLVDGAVVVTTATNGETMVSNPYSDYAVTHSAFCRVVQKAKVLFTSATVTAAATDETPPTATVSSPTNGQVVTQGDVLLAGFECADSGSGIAGCQGQVRNSAGTLIQVVGNGEAINTSNAGTFMFIAVAQDNAGNTGQAAVTFTVEAAPET